MSSSKKVYFSDQNKAQKAPGFSSLFDQVADYQVTQKPQYISQEFQDYGYRLAVALNDLTHKSLYIKMAKKEDRALLERALAFVTDANSAKSKARLFMWKVAQLKKEKL